MRKLNRRVECLLLALALIPLAPSPTLSQPVRVQFIHASPYFEADTIDVYRNGRIWLDDFAYYEATPFTNWPNGDLFRLDFTWADAADNSDPFYSETLALRPGERYYVIAAGDPLHKRGQPAFELFLRGGAIEESGVSPMVAYEGFQGSPDVIPTTIHIRNWDSRAGDERLASSPYMGYGSFQGSYDLSPPWAFEVDLRTREGRIVRSAIDNRFRLHEQSIIIVSTGFLDPQREGDAPFDAGRQVLTDGTVVPYMPNQSEVQFVHASPFQESDTVDIIVTRLDTYGPDEVVLHLDDLSYAEASPFIALPSGLFVTGARTSAPELAIDVTTADGSDTLATRRVRLSTGRTHLVALAGDPLNRFDQQPMDLFIFDGIRDSVAVPDSKELVFFNGTGDVVTLAIGDEEGGLPLAPALPFGSFTSYVPFSSTRDTLYVANAETRKTLAFFDVSLESMGDSTPVVVATGFSNRSEALAAEGSELVLATAAHNGGPLVTFQKRKPPAWWQKPWVYALGLLVFSAVGLIFFQLRIMRLRARERQLTVLVDERTRELVAEKEKTEEQARRLGQLDEAKNRFFTNISHEFRTPLTLILGPLQDALDGLYKDNPARLEKQHRLMHRSARRLLRLINQLLDLSRLEEGRMTLQPEPGDLADFARTLTRSFVPLAERRRITLAFDSEVERLPLEFDPDALEKVLSNLIGNALKFTPENGSVRVGLTTSDQADSRSRHASLAVQDTGPGISKEDLEHIFDRFQQGDTSIRRRFEGSGIGLALAKELAELHGGELLVESELGRGSSFTVRVPLPEKPPVLSNEVSIDSSTEAVGLVDAVLGASSTGSGAREAAGGEQPLILIVEDNIDVRGYVRTHLESDYRIIEAADGEEGHESTLTHRPDLILADVMMPIMDGYEMCRLIRANEELRHIPVVMLTAKAAEQDTLEGLQSGADDYLAKPFSVPELKARISNLIGSRRNLRERFSREIIVRPADITITPDDEVFLDRVLAAVSHHIGDTNLTMDWLADEIGLSRRQLERRLESVTGESPAALVRRLRLERSSQLLRAGAGTISEIAYAVGFKSRAHFSRAFKEVYGTSPSAHMHLQD